MFIIVHHELGLNRPVLKSVSSKVFQAIFIHLVYISALMLASCCHTFFLHVTANLICALCS